MKSVETKQLTKALECKQQNRERRLVRYKELLTRLDGGMNRSEAARHMACHSARCNAGFRMASSRSASITSTRASSISRRFTPGSLR